MEVQVAPVVVVLVGVEEAVQLGAEVEAEVEVEAAE